MSSSSVERFLARERAAQEFKPRIIFALDATASRQPTWDLACELQAQMFQAAGNKVEVKLMFYGGSKCLKTGWLDSQGLTTAMRKVKCQAGMTQIERVLQHWM
jgi:hypothetical protein